jgi:hypothetical protein
MSMGSRREPSMMSSTMTRPPNIPAEKFWSLTAYDNQTRSMLDTRSATRARAARAIRRQLRR